MRSTVVDEFHKQDMEYHAKALGIAVDDFRPEPSVLERDPSSEDILEIMRFGDRSAIVAVPDWKVRANRTLREAPWKEWLDSPDGLARLLAALGLGDMDTSEQPGRPVHNIALLCDAARFRPYEEHAARIIRITPDHPVWTDPDAAPEWPFRYVIIEGGQIIAGGNVRHNLAMFQGRTWPLGVFVKPEHRRKGYGKAVVSAATREVVDGGGLALWNARGSNVASLRLCQSLGYEKFFWQLRIPRA